jgi:hypothetical protein
MTEILDILDRLNPMSCDHFDSKVITVVKDLDDIFTAAFR